MVRTRWIVIGGAVVGGVVGGAIALTAGGGHSAVIAGPSASGSPSASVTAAISAPPAPTPSAAPSGFLPVDSLGAKSIPWDQVGAGWFLVDWAQRDAVWGGFDSASPTVSAADASVSLLAPDGTWYAARSLNDVESDRTVGWLGETVALFRTTRPGEEESQGDTSFLNVKTGAARLVISGGEPPSLQGVLADGTLHGREYAEDASWYVRYNDRFDAQTVCDGESSSVAPDGVRVACLGWIGSGDATSDQTRVFLGALNTDAGAEAIDTFRLEPYSYDIQGWLDPDTFLLLRRDPDGLARPTYFAYNVATRKIADFALPFQPTGDNVTFDWLTKTYADMAEQSVSFFASDGAKVADVPCAGSWDWRGPVRSGTRAVVECDTFDSDYNPEAVTLTLVDLATGTVTVVAHADESASTHLRAVYPYIGNVD